MKRNRESGEKYPILNILAHECLQKILPLMTENKKGKEKNLQMVSYIQSINIYNKYPCKKNW